MKPDANSPHQLLVEGSDDKHTVIHLLEKNGYAWDQAPPRVYVRDCGEADRLGAELREILRNRSHTRVGVVIDASDSRESRTINRWEQLRGRVGELPYSPEPAGTILDLPLGRRLGAWRMPDNKADGKLEDFIETLVPTDDRPWDYAETAVAGAIDLGAQVGDRKKARLHCWLAWQPEPGLPYGTAIRAQYLRHDSEVARVFIAWFRRLFQ